MPKPLTEINQDDIALALGNQVILITQLQKTLAEREREIEALEAEIFQLKSVGT